MLAAGAIAAVVSVSGTLAASATEAPATFVADASSQPVPVAARTGDKPLLLTPAEQRAAKAKAAKAHAAAQARAKARATKLAHDHALAAARRAAAAVAKAEDDVRAKVVAMVRTELGHPYVWGAEGPGAFDCSGLTRYVWGRAAGRDIPHNAAEQFASLTHVDRSALKPGDLVFFFNNTEGHVGMYVGNGTMIDAQTPSTGVVAESLSDSWSTAHYSGAASLF